MNVYPQKENLKKSEIITSIIVFVVIALIFNGFLKNSAKFMLTIISFTIGGMIFLPGLIIVNSSIVNFLYNSKNKENVIKQFRINRLFNFIIWFVISLFMASFRYILDNDSISSYLYFPLIAFIYYQIVRVLHIIIYGKEPIMATQYWKEEFEEVVGRKISSGELMFTTFYGIFGFLIFALIYSLMR